MGYRETMALIQSGYAKAAALGIAVIVADMQNSAHAQQPAPQITVEQRIGMEFGPILVKAALLQGANEKLRDDLATANATIADLRRQLAEATKEPPK